MTIMTVAQRHTLCVYMPSGKPELPGAGGNSRWGIRAARRYRTYNDTNVTGLGVYMEVKKKKTWLRPDLCKLYSCFVTGTIGFYHNWNDALWGTVRHDSMLSFLSFSLRLLSYSYTVTLMKLCLIIKWMIEVVKYAKPLGGELAEGFQSKAWLTPNEADWLLW